MNYFKLSEFNITGLPIPQDIADKILENFIVPLNRIRHKLGFAIVISKKSGYRPQSWEWMHFRSGNSEHTFKGKGAADLTTIEMMATGKNHSLKMLERELIENSPFTRIAVYPTFIHVDYKNPEGREEIFDVINNNWVKRK